MANCISCKKSVTDGHVLCSECAENRLALDYFIDRLAEDIVLDNQMDSCRICVIGECQSQVGGMTCRNGVKTWLINKVKEYVADAPERDERYFAFLDALAPSDVITAVSSLEERYPHFKWSANGAEAVVHEWRLRRGGGI